MDKATVIKEVKTLIGKAKIEDAFSKLSVYFDQQSEQFTKNKSELLRIKAHYNGIRQKENRALISHDEAQRSINQVIDQLVRLLENLGVEEQKNENSSVIKKNKQGLFAVFILLGLAVVATVLWRIGSSQESYSTPQALISDPNKIPIQQFKEDALFRIAILPFKPDVGPVSNVHNNIRLRMGLVADNKNINIDSKIYPLDPLSEAYPIKSVDAEELVRNWNPDLVIWGNTYVENSQNTTLTRYKFLNQDEYFRFHKLSLNEADGTLIDTLTTISSIATDGALTEDIEAILLGIVAFMKKDYKDAIALLENTPVNDSMAILMKYMTLAEIYIMEGNLPKAIEAYDQVIHEHPDYALAHNNRGMLYLDQDQPGPAVVDFDATLAIVENDENVILSRGKAYEQLGLWKEAREDYTSVVQTKSGKVQENIKDRINKVDIQKKAEQDRFTMAKEKLEMSPEDTVTLKEFVDAAIKIGDYEEANTGARKLLEIDPKSIPAYINKIKVQITNRNNKEALRIFEEARAQGLDSSELVKAVPMLKGLIPAKRTK